MSFVTLAVAGVVLTIGAEVLVRGATALALRLGLSPLFIGLTVVAVGTSSPELVTSLTAVLEGSSGLAVGNVVGSNIFNVGMILGVTALLRPVMVHLEAVRRDVLVSLACGSVPWIAMLTGGVLPRWLGAVLVASLVAYTLIALRSARTAPPEDGIEVEDVETAMAMSAEAVEGVRAPWISGASVVAGIVLLVLGARAFVGAAIEIAHAWGVSDLMIGLTIVAAGTSLPELVTSVVASLRGQNDIAVGNVLGSNIFNVLGVLGVASLVRPQLVSSQVLWLDTPVMFAASLALLPILRTGGRISRTEGMLLLSAYVAYVVVLARLAGSPS